MSPQGADPGGLIGDLSNHEIDLWDAGSAPDLELSARCQELPGQQLLEYVVDDSVRGVDSRDVNAYIREVTSTDFTAKTFRTWGGSAMACHLLRLAGRPGSDNEAKQQVREAVKATAHLLRNSPAVCRHS